MVIAARFLTLVERGGRALSRRPVQVQATSDYRFALLKNPNCQTDLWGFSGANNDS